jgi:hypothetical protein
MHVWRESLSSSRLDPSLPPFALRYNKNKDTPKPNVQNAPSETKRNPSRDAVTKKKERKKERKKDTKKMNFDGPSTARVSQSPRRAPASLLARPCSKVRGPQTQAQHHALACLRSHILSKLKLEQGQGGHI